MKRVFIIHGYKSYPGDCWFPWLKKKLTKRNFEVIIPHFRNSGNPKKIDWINTIRKSVVRPDSDTYFIGHSLGSMAIIRYLEILKPSQKIGGVIFVAGRIILRSNTSKVSSFFDRPINWRKLKGLSNKYIGVYSIDDHLVSTENGRLLRQKLKAKFVLEKNKGHFSRVDKIFKLPIVLKLLISISR